MNFTTTQLETAKTVWMILKQFGYNNISAAGVIGNLYAESSLNPNVNEHSGGGGYGLGQWTPKSNLYKQAAICGISNTEAETVRGQATIIAQGDKTGQWLVYGNLDYHPTVTKNQTLSAFKETVNLSAAAANFCAHWERPNVNYAHMPVRIDATNSIYQLLDGEDEDEMKLSDVKVAGVRANSLGSLKVFEDTILKKTPTGYGEVTGQTVKVGQEFKVFNVNNGYYLIGNDTWVSGEYCNFLPNPSLTVKMESLVNKVVVSIENPLPLYDDPSNPNAIVIGKINNQDKYKVVGEKYVGDRLYLNIGGWNAADFFNIYSAN